MTHSRSLAGSTHLDIAFIAADVPNALASLPERLGDYTRPDIEMAKKQVRDNAYYEERLERDYPAIFADLKAGKYATVTDAAIAAGLKKLRTRLHELKNAWSKATTSERDDFLKWLSGAGVTFSSPASAPPVGTGIVSVTVDRKLTAPASKRIEEIMSKRRLKSGDVMGEMGYPKLDTSVSMALARGTKLRPDVISALESWLTANASV